MKETVRKTTKKGEETHRVSSSVWDHPTYPRRSAGADLIAGVRHSKFCYVLGPAQTGTSYLRLQASHQLEKIGYRCANVDASQILESTDYYYRWEKQLIEALWNGLYPTDSANLREWYANTTHLLPQRQLEKFTRELLIASLYGKPTVIFINNTEALTKIPFLASDLLDWIYHCYCLHKVYPAYRNLNFVVLGEATPLDLSRNSTLWSSGCNISTGCNIATSSRRWSGPSD
ncbi:MAG: hypothetical protein AAF716_12745 [Cyanobacteria bacterium P01_D01_bin.1]